MAAKSERRILITGSSGFIGSTCIRALAARNDYLLACPSPSQMDVSEKESVAQSVTKYQPDTIINFAAHRNANTAELQRGDKNGSAWLANVVGAKNLTEACSTYEIYLLHISSDMVFSGKEGKKGPYSESDIPENDPNDLSWYGWTKRQAEQAVISNKNACVVRIGNVTKPIYDPRLDYIGKIQWLYDTGNSYPLFCDQNITLTYIPELVDSLIQLIDARMSGIYHVASDDVTTPVELAEYLMSNVRPDRNKVKKASIDEYLNTHPNRYPKDGGLMSQDTQKRLGKKFRSWQRVVDCFVKYAT
ncbi:MAG: dTDP-4-dehydrorhamnose reductase [Microgenomates group bacterium Gr01-1014_16]|nr:MAG: dTDP-4-dehydrorhamnose reductase [Microgenomates group bacterium Gr01-1014_16]